MLHDNKSLSTILNMLTRRVLSLSHQSIKEEKLKGEEEPRPLRFLQKIEKPIPRPPTPAVETPSQEEEDRDLAVIFLQQVIRGRAIQNMVRINLHTGWQLFLFQGILPFLISNLII